MPSSRPVQRVLLITLFLNLIVAASKIVIGLMTGALAILADGFHSLSDAAGNVAALIADQIAAQPPDDDHPYGHRRFETIGALGIGILLLLTAWEVFKGVITRILGDAPAIHITPFMIGVLLFTLAVNLVVSRYQRHMGRKLNSELLLADAENTSADVYVTSAVLASMILVSFGWGWADMVVALGVAGLICRAALAVLKRAGGVLVDTAPYTPDMLYGCVVCVPQVADVRRVRSRGTPTAAHIDIDVIVPPDLTTAQTAAIAERIRQTITQTIQADGGDVSEIEVHFAPSGV